MTLKSLNGLGLYIYFIYQYKNLFEIYKYKK